MAGKKTENLDLAGWAKRITALAAGFKGPQRGKVQDKGQSALSKRLGVPPSVINEWCSGAKPPSVNNLVRLGNRTSESLDWLVLGRNSPRRSDLGPLNAELRAAAAAALPAEPPIYVAGRPVGIYRRDYLPALDHVVQLAAAHLAALATGPWTAAIQAARAELLAWIDRAAPMLEGIDEDFVEQLRQRVLSLSDEELAKGVDVNDVPGPMTGMEWPAIVRRVRPRNRGVEIRPLGGAPPIVVGEEYRVVLEATRVNSSGSALRRPTGIRGWIRAWIPPTDPPEWPLLTGEVAFGGHGPGWQQIVDPEVALDGSIVMHSVDHLIRATGVEDHEHNFGVADSSFQHDARGPDVKAPD